MESQSLIFIGLKIPRDYEIKKEETNVEKEDDSTVSNAAGGHSVH